MGIHMSTCSLFRLVSRQNGQREPIHGSLGARASAQCSSGTVLQHGLSSIRPPLAKKVQSAAEKSMIVLDDLIKGLDDALMHFLLSGWFHRLGDPVQQGARRRGDSVKFMIIISAKFVRFGFNLQAVMVPGDSNGVPKLDPCFVAKANIISAPIRGLVLASTRQVPGSADKFPGRPAHYP